MKRPAHGPGRTRLTATTLAAAAALALAACGATPADDGRLAVLASFYPLQHVAEAVGGDRVVVTNLTPVGGEPHDLELAPAAVRTVGAADLVVYQSGFQPAVDQAVADGRPRLTVDATAVLEAAPGTSPALGAHDGHDDHDHADDDGHDHGGEDPHFWLDPTRLALLAPAVADALAEADPAGADGYHERADVLAARLADLDAAFAEGLRSCEHRTIVTSHAAFGHLAARYDLEQVSVAGLDPETEPSPARLREVAETVRLSGVTTIFFESSASAKVADVLAAEVDARTAALSPLESLTAADVAAGADYLSVMTANLAALRTGLGCA